MADKHFLDYDGLSQFFSGLKQKFYQKPSSGIPKSDLALSVRTSLGKADTSLQSHQDISGKLDKSGGTMTGDLDMGDNAIWFGESGMIQALESEEIQITAQTGEGVIIGDGLIRGIHDIRNDHDAVNKKYVDDAIRDIDTELDDGEVTTQKIADSAVTNAKLAQSIQDILSKAETDTPLVVGSLPPSDTKAIWVSAVDGKIKRYDVQSSSWVEANPIDDGSIITAKLADSAVSTEKIADEAVTKSKLSASVQDSLNKADNALPKTGGQMSGDIVMLGHSITGLPAPQVDSDAVNKAYVDSHVAEEINIIHITGNDPDPYGSSNYWICDVKNSDVRNLLDSGILLAEVYDGSIAEVYDASMPQIQLFSTKPTYNIIWTLTDTPATMFNVSGYEVTRTISPIVGHTHNNKAVLDNITQAKVDEWNAKYSKPSGGIPKADLANDVQVSLGKADTALQTHQSLAAYRTSAQQDVIDDEKQNKSTLEADVAAKGFIKSHRYEITSLYEDTTLWIDYYEFGGTFQYSDLLNIFNNGLLYSIRVEDPESGSYTYLILDYSDVYGQIYGHFFVGSTMRFFKAKEEGIRETQTQR